MGGHKYFIKFFDDYSQYGIVELICENFESLEAFKAYKAKLNDPTREKYQSGSF